MKIHLFRSVLILAVLVMAAAVLPAAAVAETADYTQPDPASCQGAWWDVCPPQPIVIRKTRVVVRQAESMVESIPAEGWCYTAIKRVNVRSQPSIYATKVMTIRSAGTEFMVTARAKNSAGELWYAVQLANGTLGYIRSDLLNTDHVILLGDPYAYEAQVDSRTAAASESASAVVNIASQPAVGAPTPQIIYVMAQPTTQPTPTPILVYVTPAPAPAEQPEVTPQILYVVPDKE